MSETDTTTSEPNRGFWKDFKGARELFGELLAAAAVLSFISRAAKIPLGQWLGAVVHAYGALFHPLVDNTIGLLPRLFGYALVPAAKDAIVVYTILGSAFARVFSKGNESEIEITWIGRVLCVLFWPLGLVLVALINFIGLISPGMDIPLVLLSQIAKLFARQILITSVLVVGLIVLSEAGVLK